MIESTGTMPSVATSVLSESQTAIGVRVVAVLVTWNRRGDVERVLQRLAAMYLNGAQLHVLVVDNASDDGTSDALEQRFSPERVARNSSQIGSEPKLETIEGVSHNTLGLESFTLIKNDANLGGCGGFNTGLAAVSALFGEPGSARGPDFVWLLDDDIDLLPDSLMRLCRAAAVDTQIAVVGSRTVDLSDRKTTIESTIYYDRATGMMGPDTTGPQESWPEAVEGVRDVDIVSACSMLVRWAAIEGLGLWDDRFFIYCDDADWCLRIKRAGLRVVCALDAVVFHTPWTQKLTPVRSYYLHRNLLMMNAKHLDGGELRRVWLRWGWRLLRDAKSATLNRRSTQASLTLRAVRDAALGRGGKLAFQPRTCGVVEWVADSPTACRDVVIISDGSHDLHAIESVRAAIDNEFIASGRAGSKPKWRIVLPEGSPIATHGGEPPRAGAGRLPLIFYRRSRLGKALAHASLCRRRPDAVIVIDDACEFPMLFGKTTLHISSRSPLTATVEPGGLRAVAGLLFPLVREAVGTVVFAITSRRDTRSDPAAVG